MFLPALFALTVTLLVVVYARKLGRSSSPGNPLPPGPPFTVFLRTMLGFGTVPPKFAYTEWAKTYGDIIHTRVLGHDIIVLNSRQVANDLFNKRSDKYSDRPTFSTAELLGWEWAAAFARYGPRFRLHRRLFHQAFNPRAVLTYRPKQLQRAYELVTNLLHDPRLTAYSEHITMFSASMIMEVTYGYDVKGEDAFVTLMQRAADMFLNEISIELVVFSVVLPYVKGVLRWFPEMGFETKLTECRRLTSQAVNLPYEWTIQRVNEGNAAPSMVAHAITQHKLEGSFDEELVQAIKDVSGSLFAAAGGTTKGVLFVLVFVMMNHPEAQRRAQAEIDRVVGRQRLPDFEDRPSLPYLEAILRELLRLYPVSPISPHSPTEDDVYTGYHIPKGAVIIANGWAMSRDEREYPNPEVFMPERFLQEDGTLNDDTVQWSFGFGRRICPGRYIADASLWCALACILALYTIEKTEGSDNVKWTIGLAVHPEPTFPCRFVPRDREMDSEKLASLIYASRVDG